MKLITIIILFSISIFCQEMGIAIDCTGKVSEKRMYLPIPLSGLDIFCAVKIDQFRIEGVIGYQLLDDHYQGWEYSLYLIYDFLPPLYLIAGVNDHDNEGEEVPRKGFLMPGLGAGIDLSKHFSIELIYHSLFRKELWYSIREIWENTSRNTYLTGVIKVNFKFRWQL